MASARFHEAIALEINKDYHMDELLLRIGSVAPDSWRNVEEGVKDKYLTHFWNFRIKEGQANNYEEFYFKYHKHLNNPVYFGYLVHLITDQYWKTYIDPKYRMVENGISGYRLKDGSFHDNENWFGYFDGIKIQKRLAREYNLGKLPILEENVPNFFCKIDELNLTGLFGEHGTLNYINETLSYGEDDEESLIYDFDEIMKDIKETVIFIKKELERLKEDYAIVSEKYKIAVDIDDTLLSTKELEEYYWNIFLQDNPDIDPNREYKWGEAELARFWAQYREKMAFGKIKEGAPECLDYLLKQGYIVDLLTARPVEKYASLKKDLVEYFEKHNLHYNYINFGFYSKTEFLKEHNYDLLIDNELRHVEAANEVGISTILFGSSNPDYEGYQASNWHEVENILKRVLK